MTYQMHAYHYLKKLFENVHNWGSCCDLESAVEKTYWDTGEDAEVQMGSARLVVVGSDFVIKWDYDFENIEAIGGCEDEFKKYRIFLSSGYSYLVAPIFRIYYRKRFFFIMPRVDRIGNEAHEYKEISEFVTEDEYRWLEDNIGDLHGWNWGLDEFGNPIVIDYACGCAR